MYLIASVLLPTVLINLLTLPIDSLKKGPTLKANLDPHMGHLIEEVAAIEAVKIDCVTNNNTIIKVKLDFGLLFEPGESTLNNAMKEELTKLSEILIKNPTSVISIVGHTDNISTFEFNQKLSENRAQVVADFLLAKNVSATQLKEIAGKSYSEPVADNSTWAGRAINRRAEVYILSARNGKDNPGHSGLPKDSLKIKRLPASLIKLMEGLIKQTDNSNDVEIEIDGLLVDDTKTKMGKDFYDLFYGNWEAPPGAKNYTITVSEKPFRLTSTMIVVSINENPVYQAILQPRQDIVEALSWEAIANTQSYLANYEEIMKQLNGDDMTGSGIF